MVKPLTDRAFPFVSQLRDEGRQTIEALLATEIDPNQTLLRRGSEVDGAYLVTRGSLRVYYITDTGRDATLYHVGLGDACVLSLTTAITNGPYPAWVDGARGGARVVRIPHATFHRLLDEEPAFRKFVLAALSGRVFDLMRRLEELASTQVEQRVARYLLDQSNAGSVIVVSQAGIASELGTAREVVFRALKSLATEKTIKTGRMRVEILDREKLSKLAETNTGT